MIRPLAFVALAAGIAHAQPMDGGVAPAVSPGAAEWSAVRRPSKAAPRSIGGYSAGCIDGAARLPLRGRGFRVARPERHRIFGHPVLVAFIRELAKKSRAGTLHVGDLSQPRGGPSLTGHASHQSGLDVDLWYGARKRQALSMVDLTAQRPAPQFTKRVVRLLEIAAKDRRVDRLFVNPVLKQSLCKSVRRDRGWLRKVRPWWGHHDHFHARLFCPDDSRECTPHLPLPAGDGCGDLDWWFKGDAQVERDKERDKYSVKVGASPQLPPACTVVLEDK